MFDEKFVNKRVAELRDKLTNVSAREMSLAIGQAPGYINKIERGLMNPSIKGIYYICEYLGISLLDFFDAEKHIDDSRKSTLMRYINRDIKHLEEPALENLHGIIKEMIKG